MRSNPVLVEIQTTGSGIDGNKQLKQDFVGAQILSYPGEALILAASCNHR